MDDATNEHYSMFFVQQEETRSSFLGVRDLLETYGLFCSFYSDRGSHYRFLLLGNCSCTALLSYIHVATQNRHTVFPVHNGHTPKTGGKVDKVNLTQFGDAMKRLGIYALWLGIYALWLGIQMIAAYSPQARGRSDYVLIIRTVLFTSNIGEVLACQRQRSVVLHGKDRR